MAWTFNIHQNPPYLRLDLGRTNTCPEKNNMLSQRSPTWSGGERTHIREDIIDAIFFNCWIWLVDSPGWIPNVHQSTHKCHLYWSTLSYWSPGACMIYFGFMGWVWCNISKHFGADARGSSGWSMLWSFLWATCNEECACKNTGLSRHVSVYRQKGHFQ